MAILAIPDAVVVLAKPDTGELALGTDGGQCLMALPLRQQVHGDGIQDT